MYSVVLFLNSLILKVTKLYLPASVVKQLTAGEKGNLNQESLS
jgi:hypothetical protein